MRDPLVPAGPGSFGADDEGASPGHRHGKVPSGPARIGGGLDGVRPGRQIFGDARVGVDRGLDVIILIQRCAVPPGALQQAEVRVLAGGQVDADGFVRLQNEGVEPGIAAGTVDGGAVVGPNCPIWVSLIRSVPGSTRLEVASTCQAPLPVTRSSSGTEWDWGLVTRSSPSCVLT